MLIVRTLDEEECLSSISALAEVLIDAVDGGASVSFLGPLSRADAEGFWSLMASEVAHGERVLLGAFEDGALLGTAQLVLDTPPNQPHRADVAKVLVHSGARRRGIGRRLMHGLEVEAHRCGRTLLTLDALTGSDAERLYVACGYVRVGTIPDYAVLTAGGRGATTILYKQLPETALVGDGVTP